MHSTGIERRVLVCIFLLWSISASAQIRINELMYAPSGGEPEWIELYNAGPDSVDMKSWTINNKNRTRYTLTSSDLCIGPHSYLVLTKSDEFANFHPDAAGSYVVVDWAQYFLVNSGDTVCLHDDAGNLVDSVCYVSSWGGGGGKSLERKLASDISTVRANWGTSADSSGSTPARRNSITPVEHDLAVSSFAAAFLVAQSKGIFNLSVKNRGHAAASSFSVKIFIDYNGDSIGQSAELAAAEFGDKLSPGDSSRFLIEREIENPGRSKAIALVVFDSDDDMTNNKMIAPVNLSYPNGSVVVNEIMYAPASPRPEWVELYNNSPDSIVLDGFTLGDNSGTKTKLPRTDFILVPSGYAVVADDSTFFTYHRELSEGVIVVGIPSLNNSGDAVVIHDAAGNMMDSVSYSPSWGGNSGGKSLERILPDGDSNDPQNFETCSDTAKSTPGKINSVTPRMYDLAVGEVRSSPPAIQSGQTATITAHILNIGLKPSGGSKVMLFDDIINDLGVTAGEACDSADVPTIPPGDSAAVTLKTRVLAVGSYRFSIHIDCGEDERPENNLKNFPLKVGLPPATVVINEIMYAPVSPENEWLELYNTSNAVVDLSNFRITAHRSSSAINSGSLIGPNSFAVLCRDSSVSRSHYDVNTLFIQPIPSLNNAGGGIGLRDNLGNLLDTVDYKPSYGGDNGRSLERVDCFAEDDSSNWEQSVDTTGATPGIQNSVAILPIDAALRRIEMSAAPVGPGEEGTISVVVVNRGRSDAANLSVKLEVVREIDSLSAFSETRTVARVLHPKDSTDVQFGISCDESGSYFVYATVALENDPRSWNDTMSARLDIAYESRSVVINEIMFTKGTTGEYFEIYNDSEAPVSLIGWCFHIGSSPQRMIIGPNIPSFPDGSSEKHPTIPPMLLTGGYFVIASDSSILTLVSGAGAIGVVKSLTLRDDGDCIVISDPSGNVVDSVSYLPTWHNGDIARTSGRSLEKINPSLPPNERSSWSTSVSQSGGTPGTRNSLFINPEQATGAISVSPNPFSPDGDGHDDFTFISYSFPVTSVKIRVRIFDSMGRLIATPTDNIVVPSTGKLVWDGRDGAGKIVRFGLYILFMEVSGPAGNSLATFKKPIVVAKRMK